MIQQREQHLSFDDMEKYLSSEVSEDEALLMDSHMGTCNECAEQVRVMRRLNFRFNQWTAKTHALAYRQLQILKALDKVSGEVEESSWRQRLGEWRERWSGLAEAAVQVLLNMPGEVAAEATRIIIEGMEGIVKPDSGWQFAYAAPMRRRGPRTRGRRNILTVKTSGAPAARVSVNPSSNAIEVRVLGLASGKRAPLILLVPDDEGETPLVAEPKLERQTDYVAQFKDVPGGKKYTLLFEPME